MNKKYVYIDEFGAFGFDFDKPDVSTHFILSAVIIDEQNLESIERAVNIIKQKYFQGPEMKSSKIGKDHIKRNNLLRELLSVNFKVLLFVADKRLIWENSGLRYKKSFYKFLNDKIHQELKLSFSDVTIFADEIGSNDYMESFVKYFDDKKEPSDLFADSKFNFKRSTDSILIQLADIIAGSIAYSYDESKIQKAEGNDYISILNDKITNIIYFPDSYKTFSILDSSVAAKYDKEIADVCYRRAALFIEENIGSSDDYKRMQVLTLKYLLFRFMNNNLRKYIGTAELRTQLLNYGYDIKEQPFRTKIIAALRDDNVIISSSNLGYKIPTSEKELLDFVNHNQAIVLPMLSRLKKCRDVINLATDIDILKSPEYKKLRDLIQ